MLQLIGRVADGWVPSANYLPREELVAKQRALDEAAEAAGRDPASIRRVLNVGGLVTSGSSEGWLKGPVAHWVEELARLACEHGFDTFVFWPDEEEDSQLAAFAEVAEQVRAEVASHRDKRSRGRDRSRA